MGPGLLVLVLLNAVPGMAQAQMSEKDLSTGAAGGFECTQVKVDFEDDPSLTPQERLERMDQAFQRSLSLFDACQLSKTASGGGAGGAEGAAASGSNDIGNGNPDGGSGTGSSVASSDMSGDEPSATTPSTSPAGQAMANNGEGEGSGNGASGADRAVKWNPPDAEGDTATLSANENPEDDPEVAARAPGPSPNLGNGKVPEDIPPADNDSILEAQIRQAATNETDPETKAKLWNEYRKYKGLPVVK